MFEMNECNNLFNKEDFVIFIVKKEELDYYFVYIYKRLFIVGRMEESSFLNFEKFFF